MLLLPVYSCPSELFIYWSLQKYKKILMWFSHTTTFLDSFIYFNFVYTFIKFWYVRSPLWSEISGFKYTIYCLLAFNMSAEDSAWSCPACSACDDIPRCSQDFLNSVARESRWESLGFSHFQFTELCRCTIHNLSSNVGSVAHGVFQ